MWGWRLILSLSKRILLAPGALAVRSRSVGARSGWDLAARKASLWSVAARGLVYAALFFIAIFFGAAFFIIFFAIIFLFNCF